MKQGNPDLGNASVFSQASDADTEDESIVGRDDISMISEFNYIYRQYYNAQTFFSESRVHLSRSLYRTPIESVNPIKVGYVSGLLQLRFTDSVY